MTVFLFCLFLFILGWYFTTLSYRYMETSRTQTWWVLYIKNIETPSNLQHGDWKLLKNNWKIIELTIMVTDTFFCQMSTRWLYEWNFREEFNSWLNLLQILHISPTWLREHDALNDK